MIALAIVGTVFCFLALSVGYTYTKELFPTTLRTTCLSTASSCARLGAMTVPLVGELGQIHEVSGVLKNCRNFQGLSGNSQIEVTKNEKNLL